MSVGLAIGAAALLAHFVHGRFAWPLASLCSTVVCPLALGAEIAAADEREPMYKPCLNHAAGGWTSGTMAVE